MMHNSIKKIALICISAALVSCSNGKTENTSEDNSAVVINPEIISAESEEEKQEYEQPIFKSGKSKRCEMYVTESDDKHTVFESEDGAISAEMNYTMEDMVFSYDFTYTNNTERDIFISWLGYTDIGVNDDTPTVRFAVDLVFVSKLLKAGESFTDERIDLDIRDHRNKIDTNYKNREYNIWNADGENKVYFPVTCSVKVCESHDFEKEKTFGYYVPDTKLVYTFDKDGNLL